MSEALDGLWDAIYLKLHDHLPGVVVQSWFDDAALKGLKGDTLIVTTPTPLKQQMICSRYLNQLRTAVTEVLPAVSMIEIRTLNEQAEKEAEEHMSDVPEDMSDCVFETFVVGPSNRFAYAAAEKVAKTKEIVYNPLFLYGGSGLGKTHLMYAILHAARRRDPNIRACYISGEQFTRELVDFIRTKQTYEFHNRYRTVDLLLVDDIQFVSTREFAQEEFFHTFDTLYRSNKQIVLASDRPPRDLSTLDERLRTRFDWGVVIDIQAPDYETREAIVSLKAERLGLDLSEEIASYIAATITTNVRQLEGTVKKLRAMRDLVGKKVDMNTAQEAIEVYLSEHPGIRPSPHLILSEVAGYYALPEADILSGARRADLVQARQVAMYLTRCMTDYSLQDIGKFFKRDHTTVMHSIQRVEADVLKKQKLKSEVEHLMECIKNR